VLRVQLKSRLAFYDKYLKKDLYVAFGESGGWYLYPHDELFDKVLKAPKIGNTRSLKERGGYSFPQVPRAIRHLVEPYRISGDTKPLPE